MQHDLEAPHGCNQRVLLVVQNKDDGDTWAAGSPGWLGNLQRNQPITNYTPGEGETASQLCNMANFGIPPAHVDANALCLKNHQDASHLFNLLACLDNSN